MADIELCQTILSLAVELSAEDRQEIGRRILGELTTVERPKRSIMDFAGIAEAHYLLCGEDAQAWVSRNRRGENSVVPNSDLAEAALLIERQVATPGAKFAVAHEGTPDESSLVGTRDGLLNLALTLVRFAAAADAGEGWENDHSYAWDDDVKRIMHQLPSAGSVWLVGTYLFRDHKTLISELKRWSPEVSASLDADPAFREPSTPP
jgi:hypothetical protein